MDALSINIMLSQYSARTECKLFYFDINNLLQKFTMQYPQLFVRYFFGKSAFKCVSLSPTRFHEKK